MQITAIFNGTRYPCAVPYRGSRHVCFTAGVCPLCGAVEAAGVIGGRQERPGHDTIESAAVTTCCNVAGRLEVRFDTLFGLAEDAAVLEHGRCRVYSAEEPDR